MSASGVVSPSPKGGGGGQSRIAPSKFATDDY